MRLKDKRWKKTTILEELHFDSGNSGMTLTILEKRRGYDPNQTDYRLEIRHGAFGQDSVLSFPLGNAQMANYMADALARTANHMETQPHPGGKYLPFTRLSPDMVLSIKGGLRRRNVYEHTIVTGPNSYGGHLLGLDWLDEDDNIVEFEPLTRRRAGGASGTDGGGAAQFQDDEIGRPLAEIDAKRPSKYGGAILHPSNREFTTTQARYVNPGEDPAIYTPDPEAPRKIVEGLPLDSDEHALMVAIRTFYALPAIGRDAHERRRFGEAMMEKFSLDQDRWLSLLSRARG